ncbi:MAG: hypothetical protein KatS3mg110_4532 [Pirellulaceae bacterium]|nr:MAG: hypothetical protein KatS3mg110_4532 [Pirellulaceae bacterium]
MVGNKRGLGAEVRRWRWPSYGPELLVLLTALLLRCHHLHSVSLCHFDEGVYVGNALKLAGRSPEGFAFYQPEHAPPLYTLAVAGAFTLAGIPWPNLALYLNAVLGVATVGGVYGMAWKSINRKAALVAALLIAASDFHVAFSRMALTDVLLTFWFSLAIASFLAADRAYQAGKPRAGAVWTLASGLSVGLAWLTKYNGWMALAVMALAWLWNRWRSRRTGEPFETRAGKEHRGCGVTSLFAIALVSTLCYVPWIVYVERHYPGGYRGVMRIHASYLDEWRLWHEHALVYLGSLAAMRHWGWLLLVNLGIAALFLKKGGSTRTLASLGLLVASVLLGCDSVLVALALVTSPLALRSRRLDQHVYAFWLWLFAVLAPCYHPYLRLILPALPAAILLATEPLLGLMSFNEPGRRVQPGDPFLPLRPVPLIVLGCLLAGWYAMAQPFGWLPERGLWLRWIPEQGYQAFARWVSRETPEQAAFLCQGQPPFAVYCPRQAVVLGNESFVAATEGLPDDRPTYWAVDFRGVHVPNSVAQREMRRYGDALEPVQTLRLDMNLVTLLDHLTPWEVARKVHSDSETADYVEAGGARRLPLPAAISVPGWDTIYVYRIDLARLRARRASRQASP